MTRALLALPLMLLLPFPAGADEPALADSLLDRMTGTWVLQGTIAGKETTHDITAEWVLGHEYVRIHEISREKKDDGAAAYEAIVFIGRDPSSPEDYACLWLDTTGGGGLSGQAIGHGERSGDAIAFLFHAGGELFHTTFAYERNTGAWKWLMDGEDGGKLQPFARLSMTRS